MGKPKYRYKCMTCGTEEVSDKEMASCSACGSDSLARFDIPDIDIVEKKPKRKPPVRKKPKIELDGIDKEISGLLTKIEIDTSSAVSFPSYRRIPSPSPLGSSTSLLPKKTVNWKKIARIAVPLAIGAAAFGIIMLFI